MINQIWRILTQILQDRNDLAEIVKPFYNNLKNNNINDEKYNSFLKTFSRFKLEILFKSHILTEGRFYSLLPRYKDQNENNMIETIISQDQVDELQKFIQLNDINAVNIIIKSFRNVEMKIPLIQYCIFKNAIECFKYLLVNGYDDPNKTMSEQCSSVKHRYEWDCMTTAIYFGNQDIFKILKNKGIEGRKDHHFEAAILSYRNAIAEEILDEMNEKNEEIKNLINIGIISSAKNNNINGVELLFKKGAYIIPHKMLNTLIKKIKHHFIMQ